VIRDPVDRADYTRIVASVRAALDEGAFAAAWAEGQAMSLEDAVAYALEDA
jgi:predicted neutral ceramidase superfamily lipid hydrolase